MITQLSRAGRNQNLHLDEGAQLILERSEYKFRFALMGNATTKIDPTGIIHL